MWLLILMPGATEGVNAQRSKVREGYQRFCILRNVSKILYRMCWNRWNRVKCHPLCVGYTFISYLGMKSWDLHVCDRASTIKHVDRVKKSNPLYNKIWLCFNVTIWSSQICLFVNIFIHFVKISKISGKKLHLFTLFSITSHCFSLFLVGSKSMVALVPFKATITPRHWNDKCFHRAGGDFAFAHHISNV